jgi:hypothetical protein
MTRRKRVTATATSAATQNFGKWKHEQDDRYKINSVVILYLVACEMVEKLPACVTTWPMSRVLTNRMGMGIRYDHTHTVHTV